MIAHRRSLVCGRRDDWNACYPPGTYVRYWQSMPAGVWMIAPTTSEAFVHGNGCAVFVRGTSMPVYLTNLEVVTRVTLEAIVTPPRVCDRRELALPVGDRR